MKSPEANLCIKPMGCTMTSFAVYLIVTLTAVSK